MLYVYYQRQQCGDKPDWQSRIIATTMTLNTELKAVSQIILAIDENGQRKLIYDPHNYYPGNERLFIASLVLHGEMIAIGAKLIIREEANQQDPNNN